MKQFISTTISFLALSSLSIAAQTPADTIADITDATRLIITESASEMSVKISTDSAGSDFTELLSRPLDNTTVKQRYWTSPLRSSMSGGDSKWDLTFGGPGIGWTNAIGQPDGLGIEMGKSLEISWFNAIAAVYRPTRWVGLSIGVGFDWRNYRISTSQHMFVPGDNGPVTVAPFPEGSTPHGSRLKVFSLGFPILYRQTVPLRWLDGNYFTFSLGAVLNINSHGSLLAKWTDANGDEAEMRRNDIGQRKFSIDFMGIMKIGWGINAYIRYSPQSVLKGAGSLQFKPLSVGLLLFY